MNATITLSIPVPLLELLDKLAKEAGVSRSEFLRRCLRAQIEAR